MSGVYLEEEHVLAVALESPLERALISNLIHEATHLLNHEMLGATKMSPWFSEGLAQYAQFSKISPEGEIQLGTIDKGSSLRRGEGDEQIVYRFLPQRNISYLMGQFRRRSALSLGPLLAVEDKAAFYAERSHLRYAESWTLVHLLLEGRIRRRTPLRPRFFRYAALEQQGRGGPEALLETLGITLEKLDDQWFRHVKKLH